MKIVKVDNFDRETEPQRLVAENIQNKEEVAIMLKALQNSCYPEGSTWYRVFPDDYKLWRGMEEFV